MLLIVNAKESALEIALSDIPMGFCCAHEQKCIIDYYFGVVCNDVMCMRTEVNSREDG